MSSGLSGPRPAVGDGGGRGGDSHPSTSRPGKASRSSAQPGTQRGTRTQSRHGLLRHGWPLFLGLGCSPLSCDCFDATQTLFPRLWCRLGQPKPEACGDLPLEPAGPWSCTFGGSDRVRFSPFYSRNVKGTAAPCVKANTVPKVAKVSAFKTSENTQMPPA